MPITLGDALIYIRGDNDPVKKSIAEAQAAVESGASSIADNVSGAMDKGMSSISDSVGEAADEVKEGMDDIGQSAQDAGGKADKAGGQLKKMLSVGAILMIARTGVRLLSESITRMAADGNPAAQSLADSVAHIKENAAEAGDALLTKLLPAMNTVAGNAETVSEGLTTFSAGDWWNVITGNTGAVVESQVQAQRDIQSAHDGIQSGLNATRDRYNAMAEAAGLTIQPVAAMDNALSLAGRNAVLTAQQMQGVVAAQWAEVEAANQLALATASADIGIYLAGQAIDTALAENAPLTVEQFNSLAAALYSSTQNAQELGEQLPEEALQRAREKANNLRDALGLMNVPPDVAAQLLNILGQIESNLNDIGAAADYVNGRLGGMPVPGGGAPGPGGNENVPMAEGGKITEPIFGRGLRSGRGYTIGEAGPEWVVPQDKMGNTTNNYFNLTIHSQATTEQVAGDFAILEALAAGG
jgi:hypothetical protein